MSLFDSVMLNTSQARAKTDCVKGKVNIFDTLDRSPATQTQYYPQALQRMTLDVHIITTSSR